MTTHTLQNLVAPLTTEEFLRDYLFRNWLLRPGQQGQFQSLFSWEELNHILESMPLEPPRCRLMQNGKEIDKDRYTTLHKFGSRLDRARVISLLGMGASLVLDSIHHLSSRLSAFTEALREELGVEVQINLYAAWRKDHAFDLHWDRHDVMVLQVAGRKHWQVYRPTREFPLGEDVELPARPEGEPLWEDDLEDGSLLYLPRGWWHAVRPVDEPSLHLTVGLISRKGIDVLESLVQDMRAHVAVRQDVPPPGASPESVADYREALRNAVLTTLDEHLDAALASKRTRGWPVRVPMTLPHGPQNQTRPLQSTSRLLLTEDLIFGTSSFRADSRDWPVDEPTQTVLRTLSRSKPQLVSQLTALVPPPQKIKLMMLLTSLVLRGVLYVLPSE